METLDVDRLRLDALCRRFGIARLDVFGSVARGEDGPGSDVDLLYELAQGRALGASPEFSRLLRRRRPAQDKDTTSRLSRGWIATESGPWKAGWKDSLEPRPMSDPILKQSLNCD